MEYHNSNRAQNTKQTNSVKRQRQQIQLTTNPTNPSSEEITNLAEQYLQLQVVDKFVCKEVHKIRTYGQGSLRQTHTRAAGFHTQA